MSVLSQIEALWQKDETWVLNFLAQAKATEEVIESDIKMFWTWLIGHAAEITSDVAALTNIVATTKAAGITLPSAVTTAVSAMQTAVTGLNAAVNAANSGATAVSVVVAGYTAAKEAEAAHAAAAIAVVNAPAVAA